MSPEHPESVTTESDPVDGPTSRAKTSDRRGEPRPARNYDRSHKARAKTYARELGPGLITGAADDDPSGISTYSQAGAAYGTGLLWTALISLPLMSAVQLMCARIGIVARNGLAGVLRDHYSKWLLWVACGLLLFANTINIAADLAGMAAATVLLTGGEAVWFVPLYAVLVITLLFLSNYDMMTRVLKWLTLALFAYVIAAFLAKPDWSSVLAGTFVPHARFTREYFLMFVAIMGTTISPYLFFWQSAQNAEQDQQLLGKFGERPRRAVGRELRAARRDVYTGMFVSNLVMYFIILTAGVTLHPAGITEIQTADQAAQALRPVAGSSAALLFTAGIIGTGMLGVPVLAASGAYAVAEAAAWRRGMNERPRSAANFYGVMVAAMIIGIALNFAKLNAIKLLIWAAVVNGLMAPPLIVIILIVCNNRRVMGEHRNGWALNLVGGIAALVMSGAAVLLVASWV
jgi:NRAMP (natural resistance-associated macrophage protein)-like metal ion transporter